MRIVTKPGSGKNPKPKHDYNGDVVLSQSTGGCVPLNPSRNGRTADRDARRLGY